MAATHPHPACLEIEQLMEDCEFRRTRGSGPGGQHRNKVESAVVITHRPSGIVGQASERRSQHENRREATFRLRVNLALGYRGNLASYESSDVWRRRVRSRQINIRVSHEDFPALLAEALDVLHANDFEAAAAAGILNCSSSQLIKLLKKEPAALEMVNRERANRNLKRYQ